MRNGLHILAEFFRIRFSSLQERRISQNNIENVVEIVRNTAGQSKPVLRGVNRAGRFRRRELPIDIRLSKSSMDRIMIARAQPTSSLASKPDGQQLVPEKASGAESA